MKFPPSQVPDFVSFLLPGVVACTGRLHGNFADSGTHVPVSVPIQGRLADASHNERACDFSGAVLLAEDGAAEGAPFIYSHIIRVTDKAFDGFDAGSADAALIKRSLGITCGVWL